MNTEIYPQITRMARICVGMVGSCHVLGMGFHIKGPLYIDEPTFLRRFFGSSRLEMARKPLGNKGQIYLRKFYWGKF